MSTRCRIAKERVDGTVESIYCHYDGYPEYTREILDNHYSEEVRVDFLIALGNISAVDAILGDIRTYNEPSIIHSDIIAFKKYARKTFVDFTYIYRLDGNWYGDRSL